MTLPKNNAVLPSETPFLLPGPAGDLEVIWSAAPLPSTRQTLAVICHPHPLYGGTMHNKVVTTLAKIFQQLNAQTLRFNFRGVGKSTGSYAHGVGELQDLFAVLAWVKEAIPQAAIWLAGFSFGAYLAIRAAAEKPVEGLVSVAPPVNHFPLAENFTLTCPWIVVQGEQDEVVPTAEVLGWVENLNPQPVLLRFPAAGHFFHGNLMVLKEALVKELKPYFL